jgi:hypothetical protein
MGNSFSKSTSDKPSLATIIDYVAGNYILTANFEDLKNLSGNNPNSKQYCDNLVLLTANVVHDYLNVHEVNYLAQRLEKGEVKNYMTQDGVMILDKKKIEDGVYDVQNATQKTRLCYGLAKFYVKISQIFAGIVTTINPVITYIDDNGIKHEKTLMKKNEIPERFLTGDKNKRAKTRVNLCNNRLNSLINNKSFEPDENGNITIKPNLCMANIDKSTNNVKGLGDEPGIPELEFLYYDKFDSNTGKYTGMTETMKKKYLEDVEAFFKAFTDNEEFPEDGSIRKMSDIKLRDLRNIKGCRREGGNIYQREYSGPLKHKLFKQYVDQTKQMMDNMKKNQDKLLSIIDDLFVFTINPQTKKKEIRVNPMLTEKTLPKVEKDARDLIKNLYIQCESDFMKGLEIFEAIVEKQIHDTTIQQKESLQRRSENMLAKSDFSERNQPPLLVPPILSTHSLPRTTSLPPRTTSLPPTTPPSPPGKIGIDNNVVSSLEQEGKELEEKGEELEEKGEEEIDALKTDVSEKSKEIKTSLQAIMEKAKMEAEKAKQEAKEKLIEIVPVLDSNEQITLNPNPNGDPNA